MCLHVKVKASEGTVQMFSLLQRQTSSTHVCVCVCFQAYGPATGNAVLGRLMTEPIGVFNLL